MAAVFQFFKMTKSHSKRDTAVEEDKNDNKQERKGLGKFVDPPKTPPHQMIPEPSSPPGAPSRRALRRNKEVRGFERREGYGKSPLIGGKEGCKVFDR